MCWEDISRILFRTAWRVMLAILDVVVEGVMRATFFAVSGKIE